MTAHDPSAAAAPVPAPLPETSFFPGSYAPEDCCFVLERTSLAPTPVAEKERLLQSGQRHYSEMIGVEAPPSPEYLALYRDALAREGPRLARDLATLTHLLEARFPGKIVLLSLARAGTPMGVLLGRALRARGRAAPHWSVSVIRDRGIDTVALDAVLEREGPEGFVFVDGWTGKGAIAGELARSVPAWAAARGVPVPPLAVVSDLAGVAELAANDEDYLIPSSILNAVVSGLVSRTILPGGDTPRLHQCVYYGELAPLDESRAFVDTLTPPLLAALAAPPPPARDPEASRARSRRFVEETLLRHGLRDPNRVKPGIGESTRALLRRVPERLLLRDTSAVEVRHLLLLAEEKGVHIVGDRDLPYRAAVVIRSLGVDT